MSLHNLITSLISSLKDPVARMDIASTIRYIFDVFSSGGANENQVRDALYDVIVDVLSATRFDLTDEEIKKKAASLTDEFIRAFRVESVRRRVLSKFRPTI